jgi:hypothetical protein
MRLTEEDMRTSFPSVGGSSQTAGHAWKTTTKPAWFPMAFGKARKYSKSRMSLLHNKAEPRCVGRRRWLTANSTIWTLSNDHIFRRGACILSSAKKFTAAVIQTMCFEIGVLQMAASGSGLSPRPGHLGDAGAANETDSGTTTFHQVMAEGGQTVEPSHLLDTSQVPGLQGGHRIAGLNIAKLQRAASLIGWLGGVPVCLGTRH